MQPAAQPSRASRRRPTAGRRAACTTGEPSRRSQAAQVAAPQRGSARSRSCRASSRMPREVRAGREVQADQLAEQMACAWPARLSSATNSGARPSTSLRARRLGAVAVGDLQPPGEHVAQQSVGLAVCGCGWRPAEQQPERLRMGLERCLELRGAGGSCRCPASATRVTACEPARRPASALEARAAARSSSASRPTMRRLDAFDAAGGDAKRARLGALHEPGARAARRLPLTCSGGCGSTSNTPRTWR